MRMSKTRLIFLSLVLFLLQGWCSSCSQCDDMEAIFLGKAWQLTYRPDMMDRLFETEEEKEETLKLLKKAGNFTITFTGTSKEDVITGNFSAQGVTSQVSGTWTANGRTNELRMTITSAAQAEQNTLARHMMECIRNVTEYKGDVNNMFLYYQGGSVNFMGFTPIAKNKD